MQTLPTREAGSDPNRCPQIKKMGSSMDIFKEDTLPGMMNYPGLPALQRSPNMQRDGRFGRPINFIQYPTFKLLLPALPW